MASNTECKKCGVAFDVGRRSCRESSCTRSGADRSATTSGNIKNKKPYDSARQRYLSIRQRALKRGYDFNLTKEFIETIIKSPCVYCGEMSGSQLDRADNSKGYVVDNIVPACKRCNTVKSMYLTHAQMVIVAEALGWKI